MKARNTSSTGPHIRGITRVPAEVNIASSGHEIAPQMSTCTPIAATRLALAASRASSRSTSLRPTSASRSTSTTSRRLATSKTGETRPSHVGRATFITGHIAMRVPDEHVTVLSGSNSGHTKTLSKATLYLTNSARVALCNGSRRWSLANCNSTSVVSLASPLRGEINTPMAKGTRHRTFIACEKENAHD